MDNAMKILCMCAGAAAGTAAAIAGTVVCGFAAPAAIGLGMAVAGGALLVASSGEK